MVTFAGFSALLLGVRRLPARNVGPRHLSGKNGLEQSYRVVGGALLPRCWHLRRCRGRLWRVSAVLFDCRCCFLLSYPNRRARLSRRPPVIVFAIFVVFGSAVLIAMMIYVLAGFHTVRPLRDSIVVNFFGALLLS